MTTEAKKIYVLRTPTDSLTLMVDRKVAARINPEGLYTPPYIEMEDKDDVIEHLMGFIWRSDREELKTKKNKVYRVTIEEEGD